MENKLEEVERDYIEFIKEMEEGECREGEKQHIKKTKSRGRPDKE
ncbi:MAG TPA: hypothetical protein VGK06_16090 [Methanosarcina sp.]|jgi:hypothetical protein